MKILLFFCLLPSLALADPPRPLAIGGVTAPAPTQAPITQAPITQAQEAAAIASAVNASATSLQTGLQTLPKSWLDSKVGQVVLGSIAGAIIVSSAGLTGIGAYVAYRSQP